MKPKDRFEFFDCECHSPDHLIRVNIFQWCDPATHAADIDLEFNIQARPWLPWYRRVWVAVRYMFTGNGNEWYSSSIVKTADLDRLKNIIQDYETRVKDLK
jgi:hypothetical protein